MSEELPFRSMDEIRAFIKAEVERQLALDKKKIERWRLAKQGVWLLLLATCYLQYFLIDIMYKTITLPNLQVSVPIMHKTPPNTRT